VSIVLAATQSFPPWTPHPEVWVLVASLIVLYVYMVKVVGPRAVPAGEPVVKGKQVTSFVFAMALLWFASDWPMHDLGEQHLYSAHMLQHMIISYFVPPLALIATPTWLARILVGEGRTYRIISWLAKPVVAGLVFNAAIIITHIPGVVNASVQSGPLHYSLHVMVVLTALLMWTPVCGPLPELRIGPGGQMIYLFAMSIVPTIPAAWLTFAEGTVYSAYANTQIWGLSTTDDQQLAGVIMKIGGSIFLWSVVAFLFFTRFMANWEEQNSFKRSRRIPDAEVVGHSDAGPLTYDEVVKAFEAAPASNEPAAPTAGE
jgi:putative membrane protein